MPYIKQIDRERFEQHITSVLGIMNDTNDNPYIKGEFFGYFLNRLVRKFIGTADYTAPAFNSTSFNLSKKKTLENAADSIAALVNRSDPNTGAGDLNYSVSAIYWGFLGACKDFSSASYGMRAYMNGIVDKVLSQIGNIEIATAGSKSDATMAFRRHIVVRGVLDHIKHETYRVMTVPYEDIKEADNGGVWKQGELVKKA